MSSKLEEHNKLIQQTNILIGSKLQTNDKLNDTLNRDIEFMVLEKPEDPVSASREKWGKEIEFLLSCIALSVGLGNVWRFPFTALENGGGAFLIPYIIVLLLIGRPVYYMEVVIGQFSSRGSVKAFNFAPSMRGVAYGQVFGTIMATTYYASIMGLTIRYLVASINEVLPWSYCKEEWGSNCLNSSWTENSNFNNQTTGKVTSAEMFFIKEILREKDSIEDGIGMPKWDLVACLGISWIVIGTILIKGVRSSGKASYFLAIFPYAVMIILLARAVTLPGAMNGIMYFLKPQWGELLNPKVWYAAVTQVFFSLAICFGTLIMYASYNQFARNVQKDVLIITTIDSLTSILAGCIIFGILGNLAHETNTKDIMGVVKGGAGLAFISYPDAIAKFTFLPQGFAVLFFLMLFVLGIGSNIGMTSCIVTTIRDQFTNLKQWIVVVGISVFGFFAGMTYMTPGGQFILNLIDFYGASFIALVLAIAELIVVGWIYGVKRLCKDIEYMFNIKTGVYWRICWGIITPGLMTIILIYTLIKYEPLEYNGRKYPEQAYTIGWIISAFGILQFPFWFLYTMFKRPEQTWIEKFKASFQPKYDWGPLDRTNYENYKLFRANLTDTSTEGMSITQKIFDNLFG